ncbi:MAG: hypothetical protein ABL998_13210, partial [Planctomycetota bacterium]
RERTDGAIAALVGAGFPPEKVFKAPQRVADIPEQTIVTHVRAIEKLGPARVALHLLTPRAESFTILPNAGTGRLATTRFLTDGPDAGFAELPEGAGVFGADLRSACAGQLDEDGDQELVGALIPAAGSS